MSSTDAQRRASDPTASVWVSASAGTGKTKVLVDRLVALLYQGTPINHIVCLTFTKAAALEMRERLMKRLQIDAEGAGDHKAAALLEELLESPENLKIMTLHAYCQSVLQKFPFEAGITPFFTVIDEDETKTLLKKALDYVLVNPGSTEIADAIEGVSLSLGEHTFGKCLGDALQKWHTMRHLQRFFETADAYREALGYSFARPDDAEMPMVLADASGQGLAAMANLLIESDKDIDKNLGQKIQKSLIGAFLNKDGSIKKRLISADFRKKFPMAAFDIDECAAFVHAHKILGDYDSWIAQNVDFWHVMQAVLAKFADLKEHDGLLDYHDLVLHCLALFSEDLDLSFVYQRLDYTIDHILIDEAQDNSPEQWLLIYKLVDLFIRDDTPHRTLFVVGDMKQSIYGFQGAAPHLFETLESAFRQLLKGRQHRFQALTLDDSFRTVPEILSLVDHVFAENRDGMGGPVSHRAYRNDQGWIACHEIAQRDEVQDEEEPEQDNYKWAIFDTYDHDPSADQILANNVAFNVKRLLDSGMVMPSTGLPIRSKDILILLRSRGEMSRLLIQAFKKQGVEVEGPDRIQLAIRQAVQDVLALLRFLSLPGDDRSLAHVLKSPFVNDGHGFSEQDLFNICVNRSGHLWDHMKASSDALIVKTTTQLKEWLSLVDYDTPFAMLSKILTPCLSTFEQRLGKDSHLLFETLLDTVLALQVKHPTVSEMLYALEQSMPVIKRDPMQSTGVRIMTVHGAKGLEAPCVIVVDRPDRLDLTKENILWPTVSLPETGEVLSLFCIKPKAAVMIDAFQELRNLALEGMQEERNRLLYVALTRPRDALCIIGNGPWMQRLKPMIKSDMDSVPIADKKSEHFVRESDVKTLPLWASKTYDNKADPYLQKNKRQNENREVVADAVDTVLGDVVGNSIVNLPKSSVERGILIHRLFELLGRTPKARHDTVFDMMQTEGLTRDDSDRVKALISDARFSFLFASEDSSVLRGSEVTICHKGAIHRMDRLVETQDAIWVIDYKTGRQSLGNGKMPITYREQLQRYVEVLTDLAPQKTIHAYILWTDTCALEALI